MSAAENPDLALASSHSSDVDDDDDDEFQWGTDPKSECISGVYFSLVSIILIEFIASDGLLIITAVWCELALP